ncbi:GntR family transcriptional regulator [Ammoniphilus sp. YIM 78166]|uniref:GntR family transcriptional regulator n=1 Tax=Ammoniphilus sp. YIM 78166 TaxID=1644106 RepID=UPI001431F7B3|nr:GntR family transcriptional regulator [Ammoniphilus sp. YIM 78166]
MKSEPLHSQVYQTMMQMLFEGHFEPGERIIELKLAERLGVSRGPVREAIRMLTKDGLLVDHDGSVCVYNPILKDIIEVYQCREYLESLAARLAAETATKQQIQQLEAVLEKTGQAIALEDKRQIVKLNTAFHELIVIASGNHQLIELMTMLKNKVQYMRNTLFNLYYRKDNYLEEHYAIYNQIAQGNAVQAEAEMKKHIQNDLRAFYSLYNRTLVKKVN